MHGNQRVCAKCGKVHEAKGVKHRMRRYREKLHEKQADLLKKKGMPKLERLMALARKTDLSDAEDYEIAKIDSNVYDYIKEKIHANPSKQTMWENLKMNQRKILAGVWRPR